MTLPDPGDLSVSVRTLDGTPVVAASGTLDLRTAAQLAKAVTTTLARHPATLVVDLTEVGFLASAGLHVLLEAHQNAADRTRVRVVATGAALRSITLTALDEVLAVHPTLSDATSS